MTQDDIPIDELDVEKRFKPESIHDPVQGETQLPAFKVRNRSIGKAFKKLGMVGIQAKDIEACQELGVRMDSASMLKDSRGGVYVAQKAALKILADLMRIEAAATDRGKVKMVPHIGFMIGKLANVSKQMRDDARHDGVTAAQAGAIGKPGREYASEVQINIQTNVGNGKQESGDRNQETGAKPEVTVEAEVVRAPEAGA